MVDYIGRLSTTDTDGVLPLIYLGKLRPLSIIPSLSGWKPIIMSGSLGPLMLWTIPSRNKPVAAIFIAWSKWFHRHTNKITQGGINGRRTVVDSCGLYERTRSSHVGAEAHMGR